ncbi:alpha/beta fold hydrolase [Paracoccaceae bacterium GXU_MW_L88]
MPEIEVNGQQVHWRETGEGPAVILLHPMLGHGGSFLPMAAHLPGYRLTMPDLPGHGHTGYDQARGEIQAQAAEMVSAIMDEIGGPVHIVGHSFGGTVATRLAHEEPERVSSLTLIEPVWFGFLDDAGHPGGDIERAANRAFMDASLAQDWDAAVRAFMNRWGGPVPFSAMPAQMQHYISERIYLIAESAAEVGMLAGPRLTLDTLGPLPEKLLLIDGETSPPAIHQILDVIAERRPQARRVRVAGAGHMLPITHPKEVAAPLKALLDQA